MGLRTLSESIILQAIEDLGHPQYRAESLDFFHGRRFRLLARMASISDEDIPGFHAFTTAYASAICGQDKPDIADRRMLKVLARASLSNGQPIFLHLMGSC